MRCVSFERSGHRSYGIERDDAVYEAERSLRDQCPDLGSLLRAGRLDELPHSVVSEGVGIAGIRYEPVIPNPGKILCVGVNYRPHVEEMGREIPAEPLVFVRFADSLVGHRAPLERPRVSTQYDYEGELAVVIGRRARYVSAAEAEDYIAGYSPFMDGSVRDWQRHTSQFTAGKNFPASGAFGPALVSRDEIDDVTALTLTTRVNGDVLQRGRIAELIFDIPRLVEYCSTFTTLMPGDVIVTGTPGGVGAARQPPRWLEPGDEVEVDLGPLGCLSNTVADETADPR